MIAPPGQVAGLTWQAWGIAWAGAYLIGSIPVGYLMAASRGVDIRARGSGNIGATNVGRTLGKRLGAVCFALDVLKGFAPAFAAWLLIGAALGRDRWWSTDTDIVLAWLGISAAAVIGHVFPVWLRFRGGKGVATSLGAMLGTFPMLTFAAVGAAAVWLLSIRICRYVGLSSCLAAASVPAWVVLAGRVVFRDEGAAAWRALAPYLIVSGVLALLIIARHRANLVRTLRGSEPKIGRQ